MIYPNEPNTDLPTIQIQQPQNHSTTYANNTLNLNLTVTIPSSWDSYFTYGFPKIGAYAVNVYLDGLQYFRFGNTGVLNVFVYNHTVSFNNVTEQMHTAKIELTASTFSNSYQTYNSNVTQVILFQINPKTQTILFYEYPAVITRDPYPPPQKTPISSPSLTPTLAPAPSSNTSQSPSPSIPEFPTWVVVPLVLAATLLIISKRKGKRR